MPEYKKQMAQILKTQLKQRRISMMDIDKAVGANEYEST
jgi:hypothetical protein